jgi:Asp-tRNA(Asn)/Glu-tRNA(Gln) amidotransferase A subunit family amidase
VNVRRFPSARFCTALAVGGICIVAAAVPAPQAGRSVEPFDVMEKTIGELQDAMAGGRVTSRALVDAYLARVAAYDRRGPAINAIVALNPRARDVADALDRERATKGARGPLHGIPVLVKDNFDTEDMPTSGSTMALAGSQPKSDAFQVKKLKDAGAVVLGKTNLHELAAGIITVSSYGGQTRNPYDPTRNPGGSSGGTAAGVAANFAVFGMGSDTCGSIRIPASHQNLVGLRGTAGLSSRSGIIPLSHTQDIGGPLARTVSDLAIALDATVGFDPLDASTTAGNGKRPASFVEALKAGKGRGARIGVLAAYFGAPGDDPEMAETVRRGLEALKALGAELVDVTIHDLDRLVAGSGLIPHEFKFDLMDYLAMVPGAPVKSLSEILDGGLHHAALDRTFRTRNAVEQRDSEAYRKALDMRQLLAQTLDSTLATNRLDAIAYPTMRRRPAVLGEPQGGMTCQLSAQSGLPAISVPAGFTPDGLPVGLELLGPSWSDARLLVLAHTFEQATHHRRPPRFTPALVDGKPPAPREFTVAATAGQVASTTSTGTVRARAAFTFEVDTGRLKFDVTATGVAPADTFGVALHRGEPGRTGPAIHRLLGPGEVTGSGLLQLTPRDHEELTTGKLYVQVYTRGHPLGAARGQLMVR